MEATPEVKSQKNTSKTAFELALARLPPEIRHSQLVQELVDLYGQLYLLTIVFSLLRATLNAALIWACGVLLYYFLEKQFSIPQCLHACFAAYTQGCCALNIQMYMLAASSLLLMFLGSFLATLYSKTRTLQHSVSVAAIMILSTSLLLLEMGWSLKLITAFEFLVFLSMYYGYRFSIRYRFAREKSRLSK